MSTKNQSWIWIIEISGTEAKIIAIWKNDFQTAIIEVKGKYLENFPFSWKQSTVNRTPPEAHSCEVFFNPIHIQKF